MRLHNCAAIAAALALAACANTGGNLNTNNWPDPQALQAGLSVAEAGWGVYCGVEKHSAVCNGNRKKVQDAEQAASDALATYAQAYASGNVTKAALGNLQTLIADALSIIADAKSKGQSQ